MKFEIKHYTHEELQQIPQLYEKVEKILAELENDQKQYDPANRQESTGSDWDMIAIATPEDHYEIAGVITFSPEMTNEYGFIDELFVCKNNRKQGVAKELIKFAEDIIRRKRKYVQMFVHHSNKTASELYQKLLYKPHYYSVVGNAKYAEEKVKDETNYWLEKSGAASLRTTCKSQSCLFWHADTSTEFVAIPYENGYYVNELDKFYASNKKNLQLFWDMLRLLSEDPDGCFADGTDMWFTTLDGDTSIKDNEYALNSYGYEIYATIFRKRL